MQNISARTSALLLGLLLAGCASTQHSLSDPDLRFVKMPDLSQMPGTLEEQPFFTCVHEKDRVPPRNHDASMLYRHAEWLHGKTLYDEYYDKQSQEHQEALNKVRRLYRIAAAWGHDEAVNQLVYFDDNGADFSARENVQELIGREMPSGYFLMSELLSDYGSFQNSVAIQYRRKAADLGNPNAQHYFGDALRSSLPRYASEISKQMTRCAAEQGHAEATFTMALDLKNEKQYAEALKYAQDAVKAGNYKAARLLQKAFSARSETDENFMALAEDKERAERYGRIGSILSNYSRATVDEIDEIAPLPPAKLPEWKMQIEWLRRLDGAAPPLLSEERIQEMAIEKGLDPQTGLQAPSQLDEQSEFICAFENNRISSTNPDADELFQYANWLYSENFRKQDGFLSSSEAEQPDRSPEIERLYRIAAAWGHGKAARNLAHLLMGRNMRHEPDSTSINDFITKPVEIAEELISRGVPYGYTLMGYMLNDHLGVKKDYRTSLRYFQKAAELGNPEAQNLLGKREGKASAEMRRCAADQGHAEAANSTAKALHEEKKFGEALKYFQIAAKAGSAEAADRLSNAFRNSDYEDYMGQTEDKERSSRYRHIANLLSLAPSGKNPGYGIDPLYYVNDYINANVSELDEIVPLPPAKLSEWDGEIEWLKKWKNSKAPPLPSEDRIIEMARAKGLDPKTGLPLKKDAK